MARFNTHVQIGIVLDILSGNLFPFRVESTITHPPLCPTHYIANNVDISSRIKTIKCIETHKSTCKYTYISIHMYLSTYACISHAYKTHGYSANSINTHIYGHRNRRSMLACATLYVTHALFFQNQNTYLIFLILHGQASHLYSFILIRLISHENKRIIYKEHFWY